MPQMLLFPDPRPLVERLGSEFFRQAPPRPGVYLMRDAAETVLYVGKAKNLRKRLSSYRVANPDRLPRRHLRLLRAVVRIELEECLDEAAALAREAALLLELRPRFNRAGTWSGPRRFLAWRIAPPALELRVLDQPEEGWNHHGPAGAGLWPLRAALARLLWCALQPGRGLAGAPSGWFRSRRHETLAIPAPAELDGDLTEAEAVLARLLGGNAFDFAAWVKSRVSGRLSRFELAILDADLELVLGAVLD